MKDFISRNLEDYVLDIIGSFIVGFVFLVINIPLFFLPLACALPNISFSMFVGFVRSVDVVYVYIMISMSYFVGYLFYRLDYKGLLKYSYLRNIKVSEINLERDKKESLPVLNLNYENIIEFFRNRSLDHLISAFPKIFVPGTNIDSLISSIKTRIKLAFPEKVKIIQEDERQVRFMVSAFYASRCSHYFMMMCLIGIIASAFSVSFERYENILYSVFYLFVIQTITWLCNNVVRKSFYHLKVGELINVLEVAYVVSFEEDSEIAQRLFSDLKSEKDLEPTENT